MGHVKWKPHIANMNFKTMSCSDVYTQQTCKHVENICALKRHVIVH